MLGFEKEMYFHKIQYTFKFGDGSTADSATLVRHPVACAKVPRNMMAYLLDDPRLSLLLARDYLESAHA